MAEKLQVNPVTESGQEDADTPEFSDKQLKLINRIFTSRGKELEDKLDKRHSELMETLKGLSKSPEKDSKKKDSEEVEPEVAKLRKEHEALQKKLADKEAKEKALARKQAIHDILTSNNVPANKVKFAQTYLESSGLIDHEDEEIQFVDETGKIDLKSGLKKWLKSDDGKEFLPPKGIQGSGDSKRSTNGMIKSEMSLEDKIAEAVGFIQ